MIRRRQTKFIHEGPYAAEVEVDVIDTEECWSPYLSLADAEKLDEVRGHSVEATSIGQGS